MTGPFANRRNRECFMVKLSILPRFLRECPCWETKVMGLGNAKASVEQRYRMCLTIHTVGIGSQPIEMGDASV